MIFNIDFNKVIGSLTPHFLNKPKHIAWLQTLLYPVLWLYDDFLTYRDVKLKEATINSQVNRLTRALRDAFENELIEIVHISDYLNQAFIYLQIEGATIEYDYLNVEAHTPAEYDFLQAEYDAETDFVVRIPSAISDKADAVKLFVNKFKFSGKRFKVEII